MFKKLLVAAVLLVSVAGVRAQNAADRLLGVYHAVEEGKESKIRFTRQSDGTYQGQIFWLKNPDNEDGTPKLDVKNPDKSLQGVRADQIVIIKGIKYDAAKNVWNGGTVYKPNNGKTYKVEVSLGDDNKLRVKGSLGPISLSRYWTKINE